MLVPSMMLIGLIELEICTKEFPESNKSNSVVDNEIDNWSEEEDIDVFTSPHHKRMMG